MKFRLKLFLTLLLIVLFVPSVQAGDDWGSSYNLLLKKAINEEWFLLSRSNLATRRDNEQLFLGYTVQASAIKSTKNGAFAPGIELHAFGLVTIGARKGGLWSKLTMADCMMAGD